jgi:hypothetical protein
MNVSIEVQAYRQGNAHIVVHFATLRNDTIEFVSGETVVCDGQFLRYSLGSYEGDVPEQSTGGAYTVTYTPSAAAATATAGAAGTEPVTVRVPVVDAPVRVIQPTAGATVPVPTSAPLTITYQTSTLDNTQINVLANDSRGHLAWYIPEPDSGTYSMPVDAFNGFQAGPGMLSVARVTSSQVGGTAFGSVRIQFKNITQVQITWG